MDVNDKKKLILNRKSIYHFIIVITAVLLLNVSGFISTAFAEKIETSQGTTYRPDAEGAYPAVVLLHGVAGLNPVQHEIARSISQKGYAALVVNYYAKGGRSSEFARWRLFQKNVSEAVAYLETFPYVKKQSVRHQSGFSSGGNSGSHIRCRNTCC